MLAGLLQRELGAGSPLCRSWKSPQFGSQKWFQLSFLGHRHVVHPLSPSFQYLPAHFSTELLMEPVTHSYSNIMHIICMMACITAGKYYAY